MSTPPDLGPLPEGKPRAWLQEPKVQRIPGRYLIRGVRTIEPTEEDRQFAELDGDLLVPLYDEAERQRCYMLGVAAERERCIAWVRYWLTGAAPEGATHEARRILSLKSDRAAPLPSAPTKEGG